MAEYVGILLVFLIAAILVIYIRSLRKLEKENIRLQENINQAQQFFDEVQDRVDIIKKYRHDLKKHIQIVEEFLREGKQYKQYEEYQELSGYITQIQEDIDSHHKNRYCNNEVLNAICEIKEKECRQTGILFTAEITCEDLSWIDDFHLTGIIMNLLDNAVEAQNRMAFEEDKRITLSLKQNPENKVIEIVAGNSIPSGETLDFHTGKADKEDHGMGLEIAREYAMIYHGSLMHHLDENTHFLIISTELAPVEQMGKSDSVQYLQGSGLA